VVVGPEEETPQILKRVPSEGSSKKKDDEEGL